jgi:hypothetical protein
MTAKKIGRRVTLFDRIRRYRAEKRRAKIDVFPIVGYGQPIYPGK